LQGGFACPQALLGIARALRAPWEFRKQAHELAPIYLPPNSAGKRQTQQPDLEDTAVVSLSERREFGRRAHR
jgi:hypothetical protein